MTQIVLPHNWEPRPYQLPVLQYLDGGGKRAVTVWARRHGKDSTAVNYTAKALHQRVGLYWHMLPTLRQARKVIWQGIDKRGRRIIDQAFPEALRAKTRDDEMMIEFKNGSIWQLVGGDNYDALVGSNPCGVVFSEWSLMDPKAWDFIRPILTENGGWAWFIYTPRGRNHGWTTFQLAQQNPNWFAEIVDIETAGVLDAAAVVAEERASGMPEELIRQEYYCSFAAGNVGTIFAREMDILEKNHQITEVPYDPNYPVETAWDIGFRDQTAIWFFQRVGFQVRVIDYYENKMQHLSHYAGVLQGKGYSYSRHIGPHDLKVNEWGGGKTRKEMAEEFGIFFEVSKKYSHEEQINAARGLLPQCFFDANRCQVGLEALRNYTWDYDEDKRVFSQKPRHDWTSHASSAFCYYALAPEFTHTTPDWMKSLLKGLPANVPGAGATMPWSRGRSQQTVLSREYDPLGEFRGRR